MTVGLRHLFSEALPSLVTSVAPFANAPEGTEVVAVTLRAGGVTMTFNGVAATAAAVGQDYPVSSSGPYEFWLDRVELLKCRAIQNGGTTTGRVDYFARQ